MAMIDDLKRIPGKVALEQFDVRSLSKERIREIFRSGKLPTAEVMMDEILLRAVKSGATELHIEPAENELRIRLGFEGVLRQLITLPKDISENLGNVLKTKANLNAFEKKKPQEGRFSSSYGIYQVDFRVSTLPILNGERFAVRLIHKSASVATLEQLGFSDSNLEKVKTLLHRPSGLLLVTGPASSGKSTTVYAAVHHLAAPDKNIITVENPIEDRLDFAAQVATSADKTFTFVDALKAILRQSPNVIMVGEIRDAETGTVAAEAALTGNLVLSSMLSNDAIGAILRMTNLGVPAYWLSSALIGIVHQQLVRKICDHCKEAYEPTEKENAALFNVVSGGTKFYRGKGCEKCEKTGYLGRTAIHEVLTISDSMRDLIYQQASIIKIREATRLAGFENILQDAVKKVTAGVTTISEFVRVLG
jgi:type II secretory ATPase GspE/PulE/Tfp pilus assembly ATPase PilB-like protein